MQKTTKKSVNALSREIIGAAIEVHKTLGPGLLEKVYEAALMHELYLRGMKAIRQQTIIVNYKGVDLDCELRYDMLVEDLIICELKAVVEMPPIFDATLLSYLKHLRKPKGILFNFHVYNLFHEGQKTFVNEFFSALPDE
jgi:GxxExxY protein